MCPLGEKKWKLFYHYQFAVLPAIFAAALATSEPQLIADGGIPFVDDAPAALHAAPVAAAPLPAVPLETVEVIQGRNSIDNKMQPRLFKPTFSVGLVNDGFVA